jgi:hypothetical protein
MKLATNIITLSALALVSAGAAIIQVSSVPNLNGSAGDFLVVNSNGDLITSGFVGTGGFSSNDVAVATLVSNDDYAGLIAAFTPFIGTDNFVLGTSAVLGVVPGAFTISVDPFTPTSFIGQSLYTFIGNGATLATSTEYALFLHTEKLAADPAPPATPTEYFLNLTTGVSSIGTFGTKNNVTDVNLGITNATVATYQLVNAVPEPSTLLLSAIGVLGLLRRKR